MGSFIYIGDTGGTQRPENTVIPNISGNPYIGQVLTSTTGSWLNTPTGYSYQWYRENNMSGSIPTPNIIPDATASVYTLTTADTNNFITCRVTATNSGGPETAISNEIYAYDADFYNVILFTNSQSLAFTASNWAPPAVPQQQHFSQLVKELKDNNMWSNMDRFYVMAQNGSENFSRINWINPFLSGSLLTINNAPPFASNLGWLLNGTNQFISTNFIPSTHGVNYQLNNAGRYAYIMTRTTSTGPNYPLDGNSSQNNSFKVLRTSAQGDVKINGTASLVTQINTLFTGYHAITRADSASISNYVDTPTINTQAQLSVSLPTEVQWIGRNVNSFYAGHIGWYALGGAIPTASLNTHKNIITKYMTNL